MVVYSTRDKKGHKGYIITHMDQAFLIDPKGDYSHIKKAVGNASIKAVFLTHFQTNTIPLLATIGANVPIYVSKSNGAYINKVSSVMNMSMINFIYVDKVLGIDIPQLAIRVLPVYGIDEKGHMLLIFNNLYFVGSLVIDEKLAKKAHRLGASNDYYKIMKLIVARNDNIIYPEVGKAFPAKKVLENNIKLRVLFRSQ